MSALKPTPRQRAWRHSEQFRKIARAAITEWNALMEPAPVCGARVKKTGEPCQQPALANGRCRLHGGLTPKGDDWHKPRWPSKDSAKAEQKLNRKLADIEKRRRAKAERLAAMTPEELARHALWQRRHRPGSAAARKAACEQIRQDRETRERMARYEAEDLHRSRNDGA